MTKLYIMKNVFYLLITLVICQCTNTPTTKDWLLGKWIRIDTTPGRLTYEYWTKINDSSYIGHGFVMQKKDTIWQEKMQLHSEKANWYLDVSTPGNKNIVRFKLTSQLSNKLVFENKAHDFPKMISYWKTNEKLYATVANETKTIDFQFELVE